MREKGVLDLVFKRSIVRLRSTPRLSLEATFNGKSFPTLLIEVTYPFLYFKSTFHAVLYLSVSCYGMKTETCLLHSLLNVPIFS